MSTVSPEVMKILAAIMDRLDNTLCNMSPEDGRVGQLAQLAERIDEAVGRPGLWWKNYVPPEKTDEEKVAYNLEQIRELKDDLPEDWKRKVDEVLFPLGPIEIIVGKEPDPDRYARYIIFELLQRLKRGVKEIKIVATYNPLFHDLDDVKSTLEKAFEAVGKRITVIQGRSLVRETQELRPNFKGDKKLLGVLEYDVKLKYEIKT